jgi:hypothetical protein
MPRLFLTLLSVFVLVSARSNAAYDAALAEAVLKGDAAKVAAMLSAGADANAADKAGWTPLHWAAVLGHKDVAALLLANGAAVDARKTTGETPLHLAAGENRTDVAELLLARGADVNASTIGGWTPLHDAAYSGNTAMAVLLLAKGARVNTTDPGGTTPLHLAASHGHTETYELLRAHGADVNARDHDGYTPQGEANYAALSRSPYESVWTQNSKRASELGVQAYQLGNAGDKLGSWRALSEALQLSNDPVLLREFCYSSFDVGRYRDVVWSAPKLSEENGWLMNAGVQVEWGISLAVLGEYEQAAQILREGSARFRGDELEHYLREWSIVLTYLRKDFPAAVEEARSHPVTALGDNTADDRLLRIAVWNLLKNRIYDLAGMAEKHELQYPLLEHLSQAHRLNRDGLEGMGGGYLSYPTAAWNAEVGEISRQLAWRTIGIYRSLLVKPLPSPALVEEARRALNVIATEPDPVRWSNAIDDLIDVTRRAPWWAEAHYNVAVLLESSPDSGQRRYYGRNADPRTIAAQEYRLCVGADPTGSKADAARKVLKEWKQFIPN